MYGFKTLNPLTLPEDTRIALEQVLSKDINDLSEYDVGFLRARVQYLTADQRDYFAKVLGNSAPAPELPRFINKDDYDQATLIKMCRDAGFEVSNNVSKQALADMLNKA